MSSHLERRLPTPIEASKLLQALDWVYERAIEGVGAVASATELAETYAQGTGSSDVHARRLVRRQVGKAATAGFVSGFGGLLTLPVALPANIAAVLFIQLRMTAAIAVLGGHDVRSERVRTLAYVCLCGGDATKLVKDVGILVSGTLSRRAIRTVSFEVLKKLNGMVQARLLGELGEKGLLNAGKVLPVLGGLLGGSLDGASTHAVGRAARALFTQSD